MRLAMAALVNSYELSILTTGSGNLKICNLQCKFTIGFSRDDSKRYRWILMTYLRVIIGILSLRTFAHLTLLSLLNSILNLTFSLLPITSSHPHASASDSTFDYWRCINSWLTLTFVAMVVWYGPGRRNFFYTWFFHTAILVGNQE